MNGSQVWLLLTAGNLPAWNRNRTAGGFDSLRPEDVKFALAGLPEPPYAFGLAAFLGDRPSLEFLERWLRYEMVKAAKVERWRIPRAQSRVVEAMTALLIWETIAAKSGHDVYAHEEQECERASARVMCPECLGKGRLWNGHRLRVWVRYRRRLNSRYQYWASQPASHERRRMLAYIRERRHDAMSEIDWWEDLTRAGNTCRTCDGTGVFVLTERARANMCGVGKSQWYENWKERYAFGLWRIQRLEDWSIGHVARRLRERAA